MVIAQVLWGFWPSYYGNLAAGGVTRPWVIPAHGAVFAGWLALLLLQVGLVLAGRVRLHRRVGQVGIGYGVLVLTMGLVVSRAAPVLHMRAGEMTIDAAAESLIYTLVDMVLFTGFFAAAVAGRRRPDRHKWLMVVTTIVLDFARRGAPGTAVADLLRALAAAAPARDGGGRAHDWPRAPGVRVEPVHPVGGLCTHLRRAV